MNLDQLKKDKVFQHFYEICQIPHQSGNESAISEYLYTWAKEHDFEVERDSVANVLIKLPATKGYEDKDTIMLQAHMDMVCEKVPESPHDFAKDPISWVIEGDILSTGGQTTLGADDGIGVALAMAVLLEEDWEHPAIEVLFTTNEEEDFTGASSFDVSKMKAEYLINLDHVREGQIMCGSCGGMRVDVKIPMETEGIVEYEMLCNISISGLSGGHSGEDIHRGRGNANILMGRVLRELEKEVEYKVLSMTGGTFRLAIPREATVTIACKKESVGTIQAVLGRMESMFQGELALTKDRLKIMCVEKEIFADGAWGQEKCEDSCMEKENAEQNKEENVLTKKNLVVSDSKKLVQAILLMPDGIYQMNEAFEGIVDTSDNLGEIYLQDGMLHFVLEIRSATESLRSYLYDKMCMIAELLGGTCTFADAYPSWDFHANSYMQQISAKVYKEQTGKTMEFSTVHAGLEVGYFLEKKRSLDAVSLGPDIWDFHAPAERVSISSTGRVYEYLLEVIRNI